MLFQFFVQVSGELLGLDLGILALAFSLLLLYFAYVFFQSAVFHSLNTFFRGHYDIIPRNSRDVLKLLFAIILVVVLYLALSLPDLPSMKVNQLILVFCYVASWLISFGVKTPVHFSPLRTKRERIGVFILGIPVLLLSGMALAGGDYGFRALMGFIYAFR